MGTAEIRRRFLEQNFPVLHRMLLRFFHLALCEAAAPLKLDRLSSRNGDVVFEH